MQNFFEDNSTGIRQLNKYVKWICSDYLCHLGDKDEPSILSSAIKMEGHIDFKDKILEKWEKRLPEIYAGSYTPQAEKPGNEILDSVLDRIGEI